jgi:ubiquinol-cytochrome c reductase cytochrome c1 subunit
MRPGGVNYIYNIMTVYHYKAPFGMDVPKGKHFNAEINLLSLDFLII